ncbi:MAG TPA: hypothetical protein VHT96_04905 [Clostridia bacterium]|nr:hypothetical protein [Clostridia bacterium]
MKIHKKDVELAQSFDINDISFDNVSRKFEENFRTQYADALDKISDNNDCMRDAAGASKLGILEKMARNLDAYDRSSDFNKSYENLIKEYEPFTET